MTDDEQRQRQHWQELAEQLGINSPSPALPTEDKPLAKAARANPPSAPNRAAANEDSFGTGLRKEEPLLPAEDQSPSSPAAFEDAAAPSWEAEEQPGTDEPSDQALEPEAPSEAMTPRRQGRKSARGTRQRRSSDQVRPRDTEPSKQPEEIVEEESASRARRRRKEVPEDHRARKKEISIPADDFEPEEGQAVPQASEEDVDKDDVDTLTDWNVPSWTELIDSLYRPDR